MKSQIEDEKNISIIIPMFRSEGTIYSLVETLLSEKSLKIFEVVLVNDASPDNTGEVCRGLVSNYHGKIRLIELSRNFGEHNAVMAGLNQCRGDLAVIMDDDFQNPPYEITSLVNELKTNKYDVVYGQYLEKQHHWFRNFGSRFNGFVATFALGKPKDLYLSSFKVLNRFTINEIISYKLPFTYIDGLIFRITNRIGTVQVRHMPRKKGESNYTFWKLIKLWLNMVTNFTIIPLHIATILGIITLCVGLGFALLVFYWIITGDPLPSGWPSLVCMITIFSGVQLLSFGVIGEYIGRLFLGNNGTPQYVVREVIESKNEGSE